ncbi:MAG: hypothetical protein OEO77_04650 [Acidimicrobiia bacterium]|nr:hypothetical protein [Acidimicrobiia bacterium]
MTMLREDRRIETTVRPISRTVEQIAAGLGVLAAAIGAWMYHGPIDGQLTLFGWEWNVAEIHEAWPMSLLVFGGLMVTVGFGLLSRKMFLRDEEYSPPIVVSALLSAVGLVVAAIYFLIWAL